MSLATMPFSTWHDATPTLALVFAAILGMFFTPRMRQAAERFGIVDKPDGRLKTQGTPAVPRTVRKRLMVFGAFIRSSPGAERRPSGRRS